MRKNFKFKSTNVFKKMITSVTGNNECIYKVFWSFFEREKI
ncbi:hypothetical protein CHCC20335_3382 [Bacillus paralicheniformis]|nr:hypothetical protein CHCC20335_3382 [Bacillus paralicheniformis]